MPDKGEIEFRKARMMDVDQLVPIRIKQLFVDGSRLSDPSGRVAYVTNMCTDGFMGMRL